MSAASATWNTISRARSDGFVLLKEWDQSANAFSRHDIPVLMLDYFARSNAPAQQDRRALGRGAGPDADGAGW